MDEYIRQLTHDNQQFQNEWPNTYDRLHKLWINTSENDRLNVKVKCLNALTDYVLADKEQYSDIKETFIEIISKKFIDEPLPILDDLVRIFCRVLEIVDTKNLLHLTFLRKIFTMFQLGERLSSLPSIDLIEKILVSFQKHEFLTKNFPNKTEERWNGFISGIVFSPISSDKNKLTHENVITQMRSAFQQLYRWAIHYADQSEICSYIQRNLQLKFPTLFDSFTNSEDILLNLKACIEPPVSRDYVQFIAKFYEKHIDLFQSHASEIYTALEKLVLQNRIDEARLIINHIVIPHWNSISNLEELIQKLIYLCSIIPYELRDTFCQNLISPISYAIGNKKWNKKYAGIFFDLLLAILNLQTNESPKYAIKILEISEFYPWKQINTQLTQLTQSCADYDRIINETSFNGLESLENILHILAERAKHIDSIRRATHDIALQSIFKWSSITNQQTGKPYGMHVFRMGREMTELVELSKINIDICTQFLEILQKRIERNDEPNELNGIDDLFLTSIAHLLAMSIKHLKILPITFHEKLAAYLLSAFDCPRQTENGAMTHTHTTSLYLWFEIGPCLQQEDDARPYESCADRLYDLVNNEGEQGLYYWWTTFWSIVGMKYSNIAVNHISQFLKEVIDRKQFLLILILSILYSKRPKSFHERLDDLVHALFADNGQYLVSFVSLFGAITKTHPEIFTSTQIDYILTSIQTHPNTYNEKDHIFRMLCPVANAQPSLFDKHRDEFIRLIRKQQNLTVFTCFQTYLVASIILHGENQANDYLNILIDLLKTTDNLSNDLSTQIFHTCQLIGIRNKQILARKRNDFLPYESNTTCRMLIDLIDGNKMSEENQTIMNRTLEEVQLIEQRVVHTEQEIHNVTKTVKRQELNITNVGRRVDTVENNINDLTEQVNYHTQEIQRIDAKTLSYVPSWGRDVCKLLNVRANNDWRLLGKRFGYSASELKHWAMQNDPSMSLLNEWFMTHKTDEATYGLVKMLKEIGREDVEQIIREAVTAAGELIPDDLPMEIKRLPPIFLSYQWGSQNAVLKLKSHLEQAGYVCWMDIGQMGGGDKLFAQIDAGIRGAKVVICCINTAYAQSDNCSREVHLTISTGKPLIPLQMEKQTWPPEGALGPIMSEYLYIRFYDRKKNDPDAWIADKFAELLGQIRYYVAPDPDMITEQYHNWFVPRADNLIFLQPSTTEKTSDKTKKDSTVEQKTTIPNDTPLVVTQPQIMISYQWDFQKDIVKLYEKLTKLGYRCWLDIFQMGGGDSLFEKIDTGIRNAKCILSCVTPNYTKSINCRREMALSDALQKPIVPLLLEQTATWPPSGPMAMVFAEKTYIDFQRVDDNDERWFGKEFELLLARLKQLIPEVQTEISQRHVLDMQRPTTATLKQDEDKPKRISSAPILSKSRACSMM